MPEADGEPCAVTIVVAMAENGVIGREGGLPWRLSSDLKRFKAMTMGKPIVMGRKTWDSLGRLLPGRQHFVVSRNPETSIEGVETAGTLDAAISGACRAARALGVAEICVIGGGQIYAQALPLADRLCVTHVEASVDGDTRFPGIDPAEWEAVREERLPADAKNSFPTRFVEYRRRGG